MIDSSEKRNRQLAFELQNSHVCEKRSNTDHPLRLKWKLQLTVFRRNSFTKKIPLVPNRKKIDSY